MAKAKKITFKVGSVVEIRDGKYSTARGIVTEIYDDMVQVFGLDYRDNVGFHEIQFEDVIWNKPIDKTRLCSDISQELRRMESKKLLAEVKFREIERDIDEAIETRDRLLGGAR